VRLAPAHTPEPASREWCGGKRKPRQGAVACRPGPLTELLHEVGRRTGFAHAFTDLRSGKPVENESALLATILADGTNLGLERVANASQDVTKAQLAWIHTWYLCEETYRAALGAIINAHHAEPMAAIWGSGETSSSDGQFFRAGWRGHGSGEINAKYGVSTHLGWVFFNLGARSRLRHAVTCGERVRIRSGGAALYNLMDDTTEMSEPKAILGS